MRPIVPPTWKRTLLGMPALWLLVEMRMKALEAYFGTLGCERSLERGSARIIAFSKWERSGYHLPEVEVAIRFIYMTIGNTGRE